MRFNRTYPWDFAVMKRKWTVDYVLILYYRLKDWMYMPISPCNIKITYDKYFH